MKSDLDREHERCKQQEDKTSQWDEALIRSIFDERAVKKRGSWAVSHSLAFGRLSRYIHPDIASFTYSERGIFQSGISPHSE